MNCPSCGSELPDAAKFCGSCGYQMTAESGGGVIATAVPSSGPAALAHVSSYDEIAQTPVSIGVGDVIGEAWELTKPNFGLLLGASIVVGLLSVAASMVPFGSFILGGPIMGGLIAVALRIASNRPVEFNNVFDGFKRFVPLMVVSLVMNLLIVAGMMLLILPGLYLAMAFMFGMTLVVDRDEEFWPALMGSMKVVNGHFGTMAVYVLAMVGLALAGTLTCGLGFLVVGPLMMMSSVVLYKRLFGIAGGAEHLG